ncbi:MAG: aminopeptidase P family protein [Bacteroidales bacterium]|nr:aminopeptidase P family protein [Bacteroidales bacterium]
MDNLYAGRMEALREMMRSRGWDAVLITGSDPHDSEYPAERWKQVAWFSGFTGEAGDLVVTLDHAGLWTDTRYFIQAEQQLSGTGIALHKTRVPGQVLIPEWLAGQGGDGEFILATDGLCVSARTVDGIRSSFLAAGRVCQVVSVPNLADFLWKDRPDIPQTPVSLVDPGESRWQRLDRVRSFLRENGCNHILISTLDDIAWTLNIRASDIEYNPLAISYLIISEDEARWFILKGQVEDGQTEAAFDAVGGDGVELCDYADIEMAVRELQGEVAADGSRLNAHLWDILQDAGIPVHDLPSPTALWKAVKNPTEIEGMRRAHLLDGVAVERFLYWLEKSMENERRISEWDAALRLQRYREEEPEFLYESFETISAYGPGAALPHYVTPRTDAPLLAPHGLYLCDSGGQYRFGTTDITRTVPLGPCSPLEQEDYTLVIKGHIALARATFPAGTPGCRLDALARAPLWAHYRNFGHGTGHGVGWFLGVHEGPQDIRQNLNPQALLPGMVVSDEPGIYREGLHGVRHENLLLCREAGHNDFGAWLRFETLTLCHYDTSILVTELLDRDEVIWLNEYNRRVFETLAPLLPAEVAAWLEEKTQPVVL